MYRGKMTTPPKTRAFEAKIGKAVSQVLVSDWPMDAVYGIEMDLYFPDRRRRDGDNVMKAVFDGMNNVAWNDDCQVEFGSFTKHLDRVSPRTVITVRILNENE